MLGRLLLISTLLCGAACHAATQYTYDALNRLTKVVYDDGRSIEYRYDAAGNMLERKQTAPAPSNGYIVDEFNDTGSTALNPALWTSAPYRPGFGDPTVGGGVVHLANCQSATTQGKAHVAGSRIVVEARFVGPKPSGRDTYVALIDKDTGSRLQIGDSNYWGGIYLQLYNGKTFDVIKNWNGTTTNAWREYRITLEGTSVTIQRGEHLGALTETYNVVMPRSVTSGKYEVQIGTGGCDGIYSPADFDWIRVFSGTAFVNPANGRRYEAIACDSWSTCQAEAVSRGANLVTIRSEAEQAWLINTFAHLRLRNFGFWIGLTDEGSEGRWRWASGEPVSYAKWLPGQPSNSFGGENFVHLWWYGLDLSPPNPATHLIGWNDVNAQSSGAAILQAIIEYPLGR